MTADFASRLIGLVVFTLIGIRFGVDMAGFISLPPESSGFILGLTGMLFGIVITPWITVRPVRAIRRSISEWPAERLLMSIIGLFFGLLIALLAAYPLSLLGDPIGIYAPIAIAIIFGYLGLTVFGVRAKEFADLFSGRGGRGTSRGPVVGARKLLLDTSVLIDGRITDIAETGFLGGVLLVPRFVLSELHRVADSSDPLRRNRGRRGLNMLNKLQRSEVIAVRMVEEDFEEISAVDDKLIALALQINASVVTNDYNLNQVANAQSVEVLNINQLANAVRSIYIPGEKFAIRVFQEGKDEGQGVGYLEDGTMVVVENGRRYMDRTINVEVTKLINRETGRMIFAVPESDNR